LRDDFIGKQPRLQLTPEVAGIAVDVGLRFFETKQGRFGFELEGFALRHPDFALNAVFGGHTGERTAKFVNFLGDNDEPEAGRVLQPRSYSQKRGHVEIHRCLYRFVTVGDVERPGQCLLVYGGDRGSRLGRPCCVERRRKSGERDMLRLDGASAVPK
jgi:hypothetical protein